MSKLDLKIGDTIFNKELGLTGKVLKLNVNFPDGSVDTQGVLIEVELTGGDNSTLSKIWHFSWWEKSG